MKRRDFLLRLPAAFVTAAVPQSLLAERVHPLSQLLNVQTAKPYRPDSAKMTLVLFMTAQQSQPSCGASFDALRQIMQDPFIKSRLRPLIVMPIPPDQSQGKNDVRNLTRATTIYASLALEVLTAELPTLLRVSNTILPGAFRVDAQGKVYDHTLDAVFLSPSGTKLFQQRSDQGIALTKSIRKFLDKCDPDSWYLPSECR